MSKDIRSFFKIIPGKGSPESSKTPDSAQKKRRYIVDSDSDDDFKTPKSKKNKPLDKSRKISPKSNKKASPQKNEVKSKCEINKTTLNSMFGNAPVKRTSVPKKETAAKEDNPFDDDEGFAAAITQLEDGSDEELAKDISFDSSGIGTQSSGLTQNSQSPPMNQPKNVSPIKVSSKSPKNSESIPVKKNSPIKISPKKEDNSEKGSKAKHNNDPISIKRSSDSNTPGIETKKVKLAPSDLSKGKISKEIISEKKEELKFSPVKRAPPAISGLWVDKYKPSNIKQIIGQQGEKSNVNKLIKWLKNWHVNQSGTKKLTKPSPWAKDDSGAYFKAALLSGPPGVGKTTTAHLVCKELEMDSVEFNASDTRSKKLLNQEVGQLLSTKTLSPFFSDKGGDVSRKHVLVMDEVDGMAGNEDRGGVQELILLIKNSKVPIICMCNDRNHPKIRSLANYCFDLRFSKPRADQIKGAMLSVCFKEKLKIKPEALMDIIINTNQDIRLILNHLSMLAASSDEGMKASSKNVKIGPWDVVKKVFSEEEHKNMSIHDKSDLFFHDYAISPLFVQENYLMVVPHSPKSKTKLGKIELFAKAAESIADGDLINRAIRSSNAWSLLPTQAMFSSVIPGELLEGHMGGQINFPSWLGKNSSKNKMDRLTQEIQSHTRLRLSGSKEDVVLDYSRALLDAIVKPLTSNGSEGAELSLNVMKEYSLLREDLDSLCQLSDWNMRPDPFISLEPKVKAAFTRAYNKCPLMSPFAQVAVKKKAKRGGDLDYGSDQEEGDISEPEDDDIANDAMIMIKKKTEKKVSSKTEAGTSTASKRGGGNTQGRKRGKK